MAEGGNWVERRRAPQKCWKAKVTAVAGSSDRASVGGGKVMAVAGGADLPSVRVPKPTIEGCDWVDWMDWGRVPKQPLRAKVGGSDRAAVERAKVMAELGIPMGYDWRRVAKQRMRAEVIRKIKEAEGGGKVTAEAQAEAQAEAMAEVIRKLKEEGLASMGGAKVTAEAGGGDLASVGGGNWVERRRVPQKYLKAKTCVIWDMEKRPFPNFCKPTGIARFIRSVVSYMGFDGEVDIIAAGDTRIIKNQIDLLRSGILVKFSDRGKTYPPGVFAETSRWTEHNLPPANIMLISGHRRFSDFLRIPCDEGYYIIRVRQESTGPHTSAYVLDTWDWSDLLDAGTKKCLPPMRGRGFKQQYTPSRGK